MFDHQFELFLADSPLSRLVHHRVRYRVFCLERGFEDPSELERGEEKDKWDPDSIPFVVRDKGTKQWTATARLILPGAKPLPIEEHGCLDPVVINGIERRQKGEVSRICVVKDSTIPFYSEIAPVTSRRKESEILLGLIRALMFFSLDTDLPYLHMLITPAFARLLKSIGVSFVKAGHELEFRGKRAPYLIDVRDTQRQIASKEGPIAAMFQRRATAYKSHNRFEDDRNGRTTAIAFEQPTFRPAAVASVA